MGLASHDGATSSPTTASTVRPTQHLHHLPVADVVGGRARFRLGCAIYGYGAGAYYRTTMNPAARAVLARRDAPGQTG
jgi:hypothetical protein